jgi:polyisoprenoid-binding protein YceI
MKTIKAVFPLFALLITAVGVAQELPPSGKYQIVVAESKIQVRAGTSGMLGFLGHDHVIEPKTFTGEMTFAPGQSIAASLTIRIDAASLIESGEFDANDKQKIEQQLQEVLETQKYPEILFQSTNVTYTSSPGHVFDAQIEGNFTLHGITRKIKIPARVIPDGNTLRTTGSFEINRESYKIEAKSAGAGTVKVSKTLDATFSIVLKQ